MPSVDPTKVKNGDRLTRWVWVGGGNSDLQVLTVVRVNPKTYTVDTDAGTRLRVKHADVSGRADW